MKLVFKIHSSSGTLTLRSVNNTREISSILQTFFVCFRFCFCKNSGLFSGTVHMKLDFIFFCFCFLVQKALTWDWINNAAMMLQVPRRDKSEEKSNTVQSYNETSAMYKNSGAEPERCGPKYSQDFSYKKYWDLKTVAIIVKETLKKWKIIIIMYGKKITKKCNLS